MPSTGEKKGNTMLHQENENPSNITDFGDVTRGDAVHVIVYTKPNCMPCRMTKRLLDRAGIPYVEVDVSTHPDAVQDVRAMGYASVPVVVTTVGTHWSGFSPERIAALVRRAA